VALRALVFLAGAEERPIGGRGLLRIRMRSETKKELTIDA
jgi:hypothetical protein